MIFVKWLTSGIFEYWGSILTSFIATLIPDSRWVKLNT